MDSGRIKRLATGVRDELRSEIGSRLDSILARGSSERLDNADEVSSIESRIKDEGRDAVIDRAAYTWFNRFCALRFMDANGYTPVGVVTPKGDSTQPEILANAMQGIFDTEFGFDRLVRDKIIGILAGTIPSANPAEAAYVEILKTVCKQYTKPMKYLFSDSVTSSLLIPQGLLMQDSILKRIVDEMDEETCKSVEVLGWLYQFYIAERKDEIFASKKKRGASEIPAATQLFTPNWIVRYMTENSLGRLWMLNNPDSSLKDSMDYYIEDDRPDEFLKIYSPEEITVLDPACGSGHILVYAFDLLYAMYEEEGYLPQEIPALIMKNNLFGFDIDCRAAEIASFALEMKAREKDSHFFSKAIDAQITVLEPVRFSEAELEEISLLVEQKKLLEVFDHLDEIGSLYTPDASDEILVDNALDNLKERNDLFIEEIKLKLQRMKSTIEVLSRKFSVVIANPPYMASGALESWAKKWIERNYRDQKSDLFACFIKRNLSFADKNGQLGFMTPFVWMFISSYERLRLLLIDEATITSLIQLEYSGFEGATVPVCTFTLENYIQKDFTGSYIKLSNFVGAAQQSPKTLEAIHNPDCGWFYKANAQDFKTIPGSPIAYWASKAMRKAFKDGVPLGELVDAKVGLQTGNNDKYIRLWWEVGQLNSNYNCVSMEESIQSGKKWFPYNKGGNFRKWYGNNDYLVNWENDGYEIRHFVDENGKLRSRPQNTDYYFKPSVTWSDVTSGQQHFRFKLAGSIYDVTGMSFFSEKSDLLEKLAFCNSAISTSYLKILAPTLHCQIGDVIRLPIVEPNLDNRTRIIQIVEKNVSVSKNDWDSFETSWDFEAHPLLPQSGQQSVLLVQTYDAWAAQSREHFDNLKTNEEELNRIFARIYDMEGEVPIEVPDDKVSVRLADKNRDMKSLISYGIGCIFGRYSADKPGLILANQGSTVKDFNDKVPNAAFSIDEDGILPVLDGEWFEDDIVSQFTRWLASVYGEETLTDNIAFIEDALGETLRSYFVKHFYEDHIKTYQKRPIYWLFSSPKRSFNALIYLHRYDEGTVGNILTGYLRDYQTKLRSAVSSLEISERAQDRKLADKYQNVLKELEDWESDVIYPMAHERISIDLDDGVKVNYNKFPYALRKVTGLSEWR